MTTLTASEIALLSLSSQYDQISKTTLTSILLTRRILSQRCSCYRTIQSAAQKQLIDINHDSVTLTLTGRIALDNYIL